MIVAVLCSLHRRSHMPHHRAGPPLPKNPLYPTGWEKWISKEGGWGYPSIDGRSYCSSLGMLYGKLIQPAIVLGALLAESPLTKRQVAECVHTGGDP